MKGKERREGERRETRTAPTRSIENGLSSTYALITLSTLPRRKNQLNNASPRAHTKK